MDIMERGCGWPVEGGMYFNIPLSEYGVPPEYFLMDPLMPVPGDMAIKNQGLTLVEVGGVWHIVDHVGSKYYPNAADWFEEFRRLGFHQRIETNLDFSKLDMARSRYFVTHDRVIPDVGKLPKIYAATHDLNFPPECPKDKHNSYWIGGISAEQPEWLPCAGLLWVDLVKTDDLSEINEHISGVTRIMPSFSYTGHTLRFGVNWSRGFFASFSISMMRTLIYKGGAGEHEESAKRAQSNGWTGEVQFVEV